MDRVEQFWRDFVVATGVDGDYTAWAFGDAADALGQLVLHGTKRATTSLVAENEAEQEPLPKPGDLSVILDGSGEPLCVIRTTQVDRSRFGDVDEAFARIEGEGDKTLRYWRRTHERFFASLGTNVDEDTMVVLERFELLWPTVGES
jgi:uncharacterized protein YhfF